MLSAWPLYTLIFKHIERINICFIHCWTYFITGAVKNLRWYVSGKYIQKWCKNLQKLPKHSHSEYQASLKLSWRLLAIKDKDIGIHHTSKLSNIYNWLFSLKFISHMYYSFVRYDLFHCSHIGFLGLFFTLEICAWSFYHLVLLSTTIWACQYYAHKKTLFYMSLLNRIDTTQA